MPTLRYFAAAGSPRAYSVHKPMMTLGRALGNDVVLSGTGIADHAVQITFDGRDFVLEELDRETEILINGKKKRRARLVHGDRFDIGAAQLSFSMFADAPAHSSGARDEEEAQSKPAGEQSELAGVRKLFSFSEKLISRTNVNELLEAMLDSVVELTHAERGLLLLIEGSEASADAANRPAPTTREASRTNASRCAPRATCAGRPSPTPGRISDSIVRQVHRAARPVIVSDALADTPSARARASSRCKLSA
jgi:hypothetical protein